MDDDDDLPGIVRNKIYENAIRSDGPRPVLPWKVPSKEEIDLWKEQIHEKHQQKQQQQQQQQELEVEVEGGIEAFSMEWTLSNAVGLFLFSAFIKDVHDDYIQMNFIEDIIRWRWTSHGRSRSKATRRIIKSYFLSNEIEKWNKKEILECDLERPLPNNNTNNTENTTTYSREEIQTLMKDNIDPSCSKCCIGLDGPVRDAILSVWGRSKYSISSSQPPPPPHPNSTTDTTDNNNTNTNNTNNTNGSVPLELANAPSIDDMPSSSSPPETSPPTRHASLSILPNTFFDDAELIIFQSLKNKYWKLFVNESSHYQRLIHFLWFQDQKVKEEDFILIRDLGRGGFGIVTACKKGTSGKLYAMKVMDKKRIKIKKSEKLTLNERTALASIDSPFVINLKYSFQSKTDLFLVLDLMTGGDLSYHLRKKGRFTKKEYLYFAARIMLGIQALHDENYVYRDLKPENCLLAEDGRVKLTDLGLATKITSNLCGAAGTRGYWAPEMLKRDENGNRFIYDHSVDWFSFGCVLVEFICGFNPFRTEKARIFGFERGIEKKDEAYDCATREMEPTFDPKYFDEDAIDLCTKLLNKTPMNRLGHNKGCKDIMIHPFFMDIQWELIHTDREKPPFIPPKEVNAAPQSKIGLFQEDEIYRNTVLDLDDDMEIYKHWDWTNPHAYMTEVIEFLIYERLIGRPLLPIQSSDCGCCSVC